PADEPVRLHARRLPGLRGDPAGVAPPPHPAHVIDERPRRDRGGGGDRARGREPEPAHHRAGHHRDRGRHRQRRGRLPDHRSHARHVPQERSPEVRLSTEHLIEVAYLAATALFILSLRWMSSPATARRGVRAGELGMLLAIAGTLLHRGIVDYTWIATAL